MSASRWNSNILHLLEFFEGDDLSISDLVLKSIKVKDGKENLKEEINVVAERDDNLIPLEIPILPLRGLVVYPETAVPLTIGQPRSIRLVDDVVSAEKGFIGLLASKNPELDNPNPATFQST